MEHPVDFHNYNVDVLQSRTNKRKREREECEEDKEKTGQRLRISNFVVIVGRVSC